MERLATGVRRMIRRLLDSQGAAIRTDEGQGVITATGERGVIVFSPAGESPWDLDISVVPLGRSGLAVPEGPSWRRLVRHASYGETQLSVIDAIGELRRLEESGDGLPRGVAEPVRRSDA
ncbi:hypothetical protein BISA_2245 [Bifidobacterium saguini DSM 23967]|uniref:Uncharacterized protein n=2 Tax=Bifidobacterium saguini TaxID=762210 RepID=A0A087D5S1_9BIFI|nr:hypothetical protein [Bifidobacterium saguini]KFI90871.1 hypothetical protein BISA_2245 [Bifidobacterium saguini DSM 23967]QTB90718.1 hypothetical protein BSD967_10565 [Bifidobacterium saguini]